MFAQKLFQPFGDNVTSIGNEQIGCQLCLFLFRKGIEDLVEILDGTSGYDAVAQVLGQPSEVFIEQFANLLFEQVDQAHLSGNDHAPVELVQPFDQSFVFPVIHIQPLITGDDPNFGQLFCGGLKEGLGEGDIDVYRPFAVMIQLHQGFVD